MIDIHWRNTQKPARFFFLDARAFMAVLLFLVHARLSTFIIAITIMTMFWMVERRGLSFSAALRAFRRWIFGVRRPANSGIAKRRWIDYC